MAIQQYADALEVAMQKVPEKRTHKPVGLHVTQETPAERYMKLLKYTHDAIDRDLLVIAQSFLDDVRDARHNLEVDAGVTLHGGE